MATLASLIVSIGADASALRREFAATNAFIKGSVAQANTALKSLGADKNFETFAQKFGSTQAAAIGSNFAAKLVDQLQFRLDKDLATIREQRFTGLLDAKQAAEAGARAGQGFNTGLLSGLNELRERGLLSESDRVRLVSQLKDVGLKAGDAFVQAQTIAAARAAAETAAYAEAEARARILASARADAEIAAHAENAARESAARLAAINERATSLRSAGTSISSAGSTLTAGVTLPLALAGAALAKFGIDADQAAGKFAFAFRAATPEVATQLEALRQVIPATRKELQGLVAAQAETLYGFGVAPEKANAMAVALTKVAGQAAAFRGVGVDVTLTAINSALVGNYRALRQYLPVVTQATVANEAHRLSIEGVGAATSPTVKALAAYNVIQRESSLIAGAATEMNQRAGAQLRFAARDAKDAAAAIGEQLLPVLIEFARAATGIAQSIAKLPPETIRMGLQLLALAAVVGPVTKVIGFLTTALGLVTAAFAAFETGGLVAALLALLTPGGAVVAVLGLIAAAAYGVYRAFNAASAARREFSDSLSQELTDELRALKGQIQQQLDAQNQIIAARKAAEAAAPKDPNADALIGANRTPGVSAAMSTAQAELQARLKIVNDELAKRTTVADEAAKSSAQLAAQIAAINKSINEGSTSSGRGAGPYDALQTALDAATQRLQAVKELNGEIAEPLRAVLALQQRITAEIAKQGGLTKAPVQLLQQLQQAQQALADAQRVSDADRTKVLEDQGRRLVEQARLFRQGYPGLDVGQTFKQLQDLQGKLQAQIFLTPNAPGLDRAPDLKLVNLAAQVDGAIEDIQRARGQLRETDTRTTLAPASLAVLDAQRRAQDTFSKATSGAFTDLLTAAAALRLSFSSLSDSVAGAVDALGAKFLTDLQSFSPAGLLANFGGKLEGALVGGLNGLLDSAVGAITGPLTEGVLGLFGVQSAASKAYAAQVQANTDALKQFTDGLANGAATANQYDAALRAAQAFLALPQQTRNVVEGTTLAGTFPKEAAALLQQLATGAGLTLTQLTQIAEQYGITLLKNGVIVQQSFSDLATILASVSGDFTKFKTDFGSVQSQLELRDKLAGKNSPADAINRELELLGRFAPELAKTFAGIDTTTAAGQAQLRKALQSLYEAIASGAVTADQFGTLTNLNDLLSILSGTSDALDQLATAANDVSGALRNVPTGFKVAKAIFDATTVLNGSTQLTEGSVPGLPAAPRTPPSNRFSPNDTNPASTPPVMFSFAAGSIVTQAKDGEEMFADITKVAQRRASASGYRADVAKIFTLATV